MDNKKQIGGEHYSKHNIQPWDIIDEYDLNYYEGNVLKYLLREKGDRTEDLKKAAHYLEKEIDRVNDDSCYIIRARPDWENVMSGSTAEIAMKEWTVTLAAYTEECRSDKYGVI